MLNKITTSEILRELGILQQKNTRTVEELILEMNVDGSFLNFIYNSGCFFSCFPIAHITINANNDQLLDAFEGRGHKEYAGFILDEDDRTNIDTFKVLGSPIQKELIDSGLTNLDVLNKLDYKDTCPNETGCPLLNNYKQKLYGRPCPVLIFKFLNWLNIYSDHVVNYMLIVDSEVFKSIDDLSDFQLSKILENAKIKALAEFNQGTIANSGELIIEKGELLFKKVPDIDNSSIIEANKLIANNFENIGIDYRNLYQSQIKELAKLKSKLASTSTTTFTSSMLPKVHKNDPAVIEAIVLDIAEPKE